MGADPVQLEAGQAVDLVAVPLSASGTTLTNAVTWSSSAQGVAAVDASGKVTAVTVGTTDVTATSGGQSKTVKVAVQGRLTVATAGPGVGIVSAPGGIGCATGNTANCSAPFAPGASVTLTASPDGNSTFEKWDGACAGTSPTCTVTIDQARAVTATFARRRVTVTLNLGGAGGGSVLVTGGNVSSPNTCAIAAGQGAATCALTVDAGAAVNLTHTAGAGSKFGAWGGACAGVTTAACPLNLSSDATVSASFAVQAPPDSLFVNAVSTPPGLTLSGALAVEVLVNGKPVGEKYTFLLRTPNPAAGSPTEQSVDGIEVDAASPVTLRFKPDAGVKLVSWGGACAGLTVTDPIGTSACTFTSTRTSRVTVTLAPR